MNAKDVILLLARLARVPDIIDIKDVETPPDYIETITSKVRFDRAPHERTDILLDGLTVVPHYFEGSATNQATITPGTIQLYDEIIELSESIITDNIPAYNAPIELDDPIRKNLLVMYADEDGELQSKWILGEIADREMARIPEVPPQSFPLAVHEQTPGLVHVTTATLTNLRTMHRYPTEDRYWQPPVNTSDGLQDIPNPHNGMSVLVLDEGMYYYYQDGTWHGFQMPSFTNTVYTIDLEEDRQRVDLPWPVKYYAELSVFRDGMYMTPLKDYHLYGGPGAHIIFNQYTIKKYQRVTVLRNPFLGSAYDPGMAKPPESQLIYVDGSRGADYWEGTEEAPMKTLQRAFDSIPRTTRDSYTVYAKSLKLADMETNDMYGWTSYGTMTDRTAAFIRVFIDDEMGSWYDPVYDDPTEWDSSLLDFGFCIVESGPFISLSQRYPISVKLHDVQSNMANTDFEEAITVSGGYSRFIECNHENQLVVNSRAVVSCEDSYTENLGLDTYAFCSFDSGEVKNINGGRGGYLTIKYADFTGKLNMAGTALTFFNCTPTGYAESILDSSIHLVDSHLLGSSGSLMTPLLNVRNNSMIWMDGGSIRYQGGDGIRLEGNSTAVLSGVTIENNAGNGLLAYMDSSARAINCIFNSNHYAGVAASHLSSVSLFSCSGSQNGTYGIWQDQYGIVTKEGTTLTGTSGESYIFIPGGNTVAATGSDLYVGPLDMKIQTGTGLTKRITTHLSQDDKRLVLEVDPYALAKPPRNQLYKYTGPIAPGEEIVFALTVTGEIFNSKVLKFYPNPAVISANIRTQRSNRNQFIELDSHDGTDFQSDRVKLKLWPTLGYVRSPSWFYSSYGTGASLPVYGVQTLNSFTCNCSTSSNTNVRVSFSIDSGSTWLRYMGSGQWNILPGTTITEQMGNGDTWNSVNSYHGLAWSSLLQDAQDNIQVAFYLERDDDALFSTPSVFSYTWDYVEPGYTRDVTQMFDLKFFSGRMSATNTSGSTLQPPIYFSILPLVERLY